MSQFQPFHPDHEILGTNMRDIASAINSANFLHIYEEYDLMNIDPEAWYPLQTILDVLSEVQEMPGSMLNLVSIGMQAIEVTHMPPELAEMPFDEVIALAPEVYRMNHRGTDIGGITVEKIGENHYRQEVRVPFPDDLWYGVIYAFVRRALPEGTEFQVYYDPDLPRRDNGGEFTVFHITLE